MCFGFLFAGICDKCDQGCNACLNISENGNGYINDLQQQN